MKCPKCKSTETKVIESREVAGGEGIRRRRECLKCSNRFTTYERIERPHLIVVKKDGTRETFNRDKLLAGIDRATEKTSVSVADREDIVAKIERQLYQFGEPEVASKVIGELVMNELSKYDDVAYVRFASVYRNFRSIEGFEEELERIKRRAQSKNKD